MSAQIHDLGYREFDGERAGVANAMRSLAVHACQRALGLKRAARHKILPVIVILLAFIPAIVFVGLAAFLPSSTIIQDNILPDYADFYGFIQFTSIFLFASFVAPEAICTDRRTGMLALYLASPLNRTTYIVSKVAAVLAVLLTITLLPLLFLLIAYSLAGTGPDGIVEFAEIAMRILASGLLVAAYFAALTSAISSMTPRRGIASAAIVMSFFVPSAVINAIVEATDAPDELGLLSIFELPFRSAQWLLEGVPTADPGLSQVSGSLALAVTLGATVLFGGFAWWRYQTLEVDR